MFFLLLVSCESESYAEKIKRKVDNDVQLVKMNQAKIDYENKLMDSAMKGGERVKPYLDRINRLREANDSILSEDRMLLDQMK